MDALLVLALLMLPESPLDWAAWDVDLGTITAIASALDLLDRDIPVLGLPGPRRGAGFLRYVRDLWHRCRRCPPSADAWRFPTHEQTGECLSLALRRQKWLRATYVPPLYADAMKACQAEQAQRVNVWNDVMTATAPPSQCSRSSRRLALANLLAAIGPEAYYRGILPHPVPLEEE